MTEAAGGLFASSGRPGSTNSRPRGYLMAVSGALAFSLNGSVSKVTLSSGIDSLSLVLLRCAGATAAFLILLVCIAPARLRIRRDEWPLLLFYGVVGIALVQWLYFVAIARLPVGMALLLEFTAPVFVAVWARFVQRLHVGRSVWLALALALAGLTLVAQVWQGARLDLVGVWAGLGAAVALATAYLAGAKAIASRDTLSVAFWAFSVATVFWSIAHPWWSVPWPQMNQVVSLQGALDQFDVPVYALIAWIVLLGTVVPFLLVIGALRHLATTEAGIVGMVEPVLAGCIAWIWLAEALTPTQVIGAIVVLVGIAIAQRATI